MRFANGIFERLGMHYFGSFDLRLDFRGRRADGVNPFHALAQQIVQHGVVAALVLAAENQVDVRRETIPAP